MNRISIILFCTLIFTWAYGLLALSHPATLGLPVAILEGEAGAPFAYRILTPWLLSVIGITLESAILWHGLCYALMLVSLARWSQQEKFNFEYSAMLITLAALTMLPTWYGSTYAVTEWALFALGLATVRRAHVVFWIVLVIVGTLNREMTGVLLVLLMWGERRFWISPAIAWCVTMVALYTLIDAPVWGNSNVLSKNLEPWRWQGAILHLTLLAPMVTMLNARRLAMSSNVMFRIAVVAVPYIALFLALAIWQETRLLMPVIMLTLPAIASSKFNS